MSKVKTQYVCQNCGYTSPRYLGRCPNCNEWNTLVEEKTVDAKQKKYNLSSFSNKYSKPELIKDVNLKDAPRFKTNLNEFNHVLGGGIVPGSLILIGGDPGIGKSTLLTQISGHIGNNKKVLYVSGEESTAQIKLRCDRLNVNSDNVYLYSETDIDNIIEQINDLKPDFVIIDSIQTMNDSEINSASGSVAQIREITSKLVRIAKTNQVAIFIVGHVTKGGAIAGPKVLEHMVDTVLYFEGDLHHNYRILRAVKNRFGSTNELAMFEMYKDGLREITNPSKIFLEERLNNVVGSSIVVSMEGTRPILVEIQALTTNSVFGNSQRTAQGLDRNRVSLIMAVLEKSAHLNLQSQDVYLKAVGGVRLDEPAIDLSIAIAIASSFKNVVVNNNDCFVGELGLTGEIRKIDQIEKRIIEAEKLGFKHIFIPQGNLKGATITPNIEIVEVRTIQEALKKASIIP